MKTLSVSVPGKQGSNVMQKIKLYLWTVFLCVSFHDTGYNTDIY